MGTKGECEAAVARIAQVLTVLEVSPLRPNRGQSAQVRVYLEVRIPQGAGQPAALESDA